MAAMLNDIYFPEKLARSEQQALVEKLRSLISEAPLYRPVMPRSGKPLSVRMTNLGQVGWISDKAGYRYDPRHPETCKLWPSIPGSLLDLWQEVTPEGTPLPDACLVNFYDADAKMGLHRDEDEADLTQPVVSVSLGDDALFRLGGLSRKDKTSSLRLRSGDVVVLHGDNRLAYHGIGRIYPGTSTLLKQGGRINLTLRVAEMRG